MPPPPTGPPGGQPTPQQGSAPQPPDPFTQADTLTLQRLQQALSAAHSQVDDGTLTPQEGQQFKQQIQQRMAPLVARQQQAQQQAQEQQAQQLMHQTAQMEAMEQQNAVSRAQGFKDRVATFTDPVTGRSAFFYEEKPNQWAEIEFKTAMADEKVGGGGGEG